MKMTPRTRPAVSITIDADLLRVVEERDLRLSGLVSKLLRAHFQRLGYLKALPGGEG